MALFLYIIEQKKCKNFLLFIGQKIKIFEIDKIGNPFSTNGLGVIFEKLLRHE